MGACACALKNTGKKYQENQITAQDEDQIQKEIQVGVDSVDRLKPVSDPQSVKQIGVLKQKLHYEIDQEPTFQKWPSLSSKRHPTITINRKVYSLESNTVTSNRSYRSNINDIEEKNYYSESQAQQQNFANKNIYKQTAKHRNTAFNQSSLLGLGLREQDNALIQRTFNIDAPIKLEAIELKIGVTYLGEWLNAMRHGEGIQVWEDCSRYEGAWKNNQMNGNGKLIYSDGDLYKGGWKDDFFQGYGKYTCENGYLYEGEWHEGKKSGEGTQIWEDQQIYVGWFKEGCKHGKGLMKFKDGSFYQGQFSCNQINGQGKYVWKNNRQYEGEWIRNKMCGFGTLRWADGRQYKGQWMDDKRHGKGEMLYADGSRYVGEWSNGKQDGQGELYDGAKLKFAGQWKGGKRLGKNNKYQSSCSNYSR